MSTIKTKNIQQTVISGTTQPLKIGGILEDGSDAKISIGSDGTTTVVGTGQLIAEYVVSGSAVTSVNFSGLDINSHKSYRIEIEAVNATSSRPVIYLFINGDTTISNYKGEQTDGWGSSTASTSSDSPILCTLYPNTRTFGISFLGFPNNYASIVAQNVGNNSGYVEVNIRYIMKKSTVSNITQLTFTSSESNAIGVGSKIRIYRG